MLSYLPLQNNSKADPAMETLTIESDIRDLGVIEPYCSRESQKSSECLVYVLSGPEVRNMRTGQIKQAGWIL